MMKKNVATKSNLALEHVFLAVGQNNFSNKILSFQLVTIRAWNGQARKHEVGMSKCFERGLESRKVKKAKTKHTICSQFFNQQKCKGINFNDFSLQIKGHLTWKFKKIKFSEPFFICLLFNQAHFLVNVDLVGFAFYHLDGKLPNDFFKICIYLF